jgi:hypothetical protein
MPRTKSFPPQLRRFLLLPALVGAVLLTSAAHVWSVENPPNCTEPNVEISIREFLDTNDDGTPDVALATGASKRAGDVILYQAILTHQDATRCGYEGGRLCIDTPQLGCADAGVPAVDPPSFTTVGAGECCAADIGNAVPLVCNPAFCVPAGTSQHFSNFIRYVVNPADEANPPPPALTCPAGCPQQVQDRCQPGELRAHAYYDRGTSKQEQDVIPANASIPICNQIDIDVRHFMCYEPLKYNANRTARLQDRFRTIENAGIVNLKRLCNPADKNEEHPESLTFPDHLASYEVSTAAVPKVKVDVINQFGSRLIELERPIRLLVPTAKGALGNPPQPPAGAPNPPLIDHFLCYSVRGTSINESVMVDDQFNPSAPLLASVRQPELVCVPVNKNNEGFVNPNGANGTGLACYDVDTTPDRQEYTGDFVMQNQFTNGPLQRELHGPRELCVQSTISLD